MYRRRWLRHYPRWVIIVCSIFYKAVLKTGTVEEQRSILLNLWRFAERVPHVEDVYADV
jgi:hypothetical protein